MYQQESHREFHEWYTQIDGLNEKRNIPTKYPPSFPSMINVTHQAHNTRLTNKPPPFTQTPKLSLEMGSTERKDVLKYIHVNEFIRRARRDQPIERIGPIGSPLSVQVRAKVTSWAQQMKAKG